MVRGALAKRRAGLQAGGISCYFASLDNDAAQFTLGLALSARTFDQIEYDLWNDSVADRVDPERSRFVPCASRALLRKLTGVGNYDEELSVCEMAR